MRTLAPLLAALLLLTGCTSMLAPNDVDAQRLEALAADPLLNGGTADAADTEIRASVTLTNSWTVIDIDGVWILTKEFLEDLRASGWIVTLQNCNATEDAGLISAQLVAIKDFDGFTAGMTVDTNGDGATLRAFAPFHLEDPNPWQRQDPQVGGCLDGAMPTAPTITDPNPDVGPHYPAEQ
jgi:hypothetical protein